MRNYSFLIEEGSGNVFADIGLPDAEERLTKAGLAMRVTEAIRAGKFTQAKAAKLLDIDQPKISRFLRRRVSEFSLLQMKSWIASLCSQ